ncbi:RNA-directed DNA polymerase, eukaryota [Tanacetum coccineum]
MDQIIKRDSMQETNDHKRKLADKGNIVNNNNYQNNYNNNNRNDDYHRQQNRRQETFKIYTATNGYTRNRPLCERCTLHHIGPCTVKCRTCNKIGHLTKNCKRPATGNNQQTISVTCNACGKKKRTFTANHILSDLKKSQVQKGSKRNQETKPGSRYSRRTKPKVPILTRFQAISSNQAHTPATIDTESGPEEAPSETDEFEALEPSDTRIASSYSTAPSDSTTPLSLDHPRGQTSPALTRVSYYLMTTRMAVRTQPTLSSGMSARIAKAIALSSTSFCKRYRSSYETPSPSLSLTLPIRKRYQGISELVEDTKDKSLDSDIEGPSSVDEGPGSEDEGPDSEEEEEVIPEVGIKSSRSVTEQQRVEETHAPRPLVCATLVDLVDGTAYIDILIYVPSVCIPVQIPPLPECSSGSLPVSPSSPAVLIPVASPATTPATTIAVDEGEFVEVGVQLKLHRSILYDHTHRLDALPPALFEGYDRELASNTESNKEVRSLRILSLGHSIM